MPKRIAIVHYWLTGMGGGENVLETLCKMFPQADVYTHCYAPEKISDFLNKRIVRTTFINRIPFSQKIYRHCLPLMPLALEQLDLTDYDLIISSESGPAKGVIGRSDIPHICYCHTPMRYLWDQYPQYIRKFNKITRFVARPLFHYLRMWDVLSAERPDVFVANSTSVAQRISKFWGKKATVIHPPVDTAFFKKHQPKNGNYYLFVGRLVDYKRPDLAIKCCETLKRDLRVVGDGPDLQNLKKLAGENTTFMGRVDREDLAQLYAGAKAILFPGEEDFGMVPIEAMACGKPVIAYGRGGALDYISEKNGIFFMNQDVDSLEEAILEFEANAMRFDPEAISNHAEQFSEPVFITRFRKLLGELDIGFK